MSLNKSKILYGIAIFMMVYHHMFCIPERLQCEYFSMLNNIYTGLEIKIAWFFKICVAIYAFVSGYGIFRSTSLEDVDGTYELLKANYKYIIYHIFKFMKKYWIVFIVFVPMRWCFENLPNISFSKTIFSILGLSNDYNSEWWYVRQYLMMLLAYPIINVCFCRCISTNFLKKILSIIMKILAIIFIFIIFSRLCNIKYLIIFIEGYLIAKLDIFEYINKKIFKKNTQFVGLFILVISIWLRVIYSNSASYMTIDILITPIFIYSICLLVEEDSIYAKSMQWFGKYSTYIWLTHTFFCYYYFRKWIVMSQISTIMFLSTLCCSIVSALIMTWLENRLHSIWKEKNLKEKIYEILRKRIKRNAAYFYSWK